MRAVECLSKILKGFAKNLTPQRVNGQTEFLKLALRTSEGER